jgi:hypothetical protein
VSLIYHCRLLFLLEQQGKLGQPMGLKQGATWAAVQNGECEDAKQTEQTETAQENQPQQQQQQQQVDERAKGEGGGGDGGGGQKVEESELPLWKRYFMCYICVTLIIVSISVNWHET